MSGYYDISSANERVVELRPLLMALRDDRNRVAKARREIDALRAGEDGAGGEAALEGARRRLAATVRRMEASVAQIEAWGVTLRDIGTGLVDFPALVNGRPIWLCWRLGEADIEWWHEMDAGVAGRTRLIELH